MLSNLTNTADRADGALVLRLVPALIECAGLEWTSTVNWCVRSGADVKVDVLVKLYWVGINWVALANGLHSSGLE